MYEKIVTTPFGPWVIQTLERRITWMAPIEKPRTRHIEKNAAILQLAEQQLLQYMEGERESFDLPIAAEATDVQADIYEAIMLIPYGETRTAQQVAAVVERPAALDAVKRALHQNGLWLTVPSHRVIGIDGPEAFPHERALQQQLLRHERSYRKV